MLQCDEQNGFTAQLYWHRGILFFTCMMLVFLQDPQSNLKDTVYAGISKSMYADSILSVDSKFTLMKYLTRSI